MNPPATVHVNKSHRRNVLKDAKIGLDLDRFELASIGNTDFCNHNLTS